MSADVYLITGATSGIGYCLTTQLAALDHKIVAVGRNEAKLVEIAKEHPNVTCKFFDVSQLSEISNFITETFRTHPDINVIINNAGIQDNVRLDAVDYDVQKIEREIAINLTAPIEISRASLTLLTENKRPAIVNVTSGLALVPKLTSAVYSATKSGLQLFSDGLRAQMGNRLDVIEVILPIVDTPMTRGRGTDKISAEEAAKQIIAGIAKRNPKIYVGKAKFLPVLMRVAPSIARKIMQKT